MSIGTDDGNRGGSRIIGSGATHGDRARARCRVVLDTNVWLDWLVFDDPGIGWLRALLADGLCEPLTAPDARAELALVLARPAFGLDARGVAARLAAHDAIVTLHDAPRAPVPLVCRDSDDQKFVELAVAGGARLLLTKDRALLALARRAAKGWGLRILRPGDAAAVAFAHELRQCPAG